MSNPNDLNFNINMTSQPQQEKYQKISSSQIPSSNQQQNYEENQKEDYLTKTIFESIMARRRAKIQGEYDAERKEQEDREKELMRQQYLLNSINPRGPKSYVDNLINKEIPKMEFGNLASEEQLLDDLNDRECEEYGEDEKEEETEEILK